MFTRGYCYKNYLKTGISGKVRYHTGRGSDIFEAIWGLWDLLLCLQIFKDSWDSWEPGTVLNRSVLGFSPPLWPGIHGSWLSWNCWGMGSRSLPKSHKMKFLVLWNDWMTFKFQLECSWSLFELLRFWNRSSRFSWIWVHKTGSWFENNGNLRFRQPLELVHVTLHVYIVTLHFLALEALDVRPLYFFSSRTGQHATPAQLQQHYLRCPASSKPLAVLYLLETGMKSSFRY